jgi:hypothetical protein
VKVYKRQQQNTQLPLVTFPYQANPRLALIRAVPEYARDHRSEPRVLLCTRTTTGVVFGIYCLAHTTSLFPTTTMSTPILLLPPALSPIQFLESSRHRLTGIIIPPLVSRPAPRLLKKIFCRPGSYCNLWSRPLLLVR